MVECLANRLIQPPSGVLLFPGLHTKARPHLNKQRMLAKGGGGDVMPPSPYVGSVFAAAVTARDGSVKFEGAPGVVFFILTAFSRDEDDMTSHA